MEIFLTSGVTNTGHENSGGFTVRCVINGKTMAYSHYQELAPGQIIKDEGTAFTWVPEKAGEYRISFIVDSDNNALESRRFNNIAYTTIQVTHK